MAGLARGDRCGQRGTGAKNGMRRGVPPPHTTGGAGAASEKPRRSKKLARRSPRPGPSVQDFCPAGAPEGGRTERRTDRRMSGTAGRGLPGPASAARHGRPWRCLPCRLDAPSPPFRSCRTFLRPRRLPAVPAGRAAALPHAPAKGIRHTAFHTRHVTHALLRREGGPGALTDAAAAAGRARAVRPHGEGGNRTVRRAAGGRSAPGRTRGRSHTKRAPEDRGPCCYMPRQALRPDMGTPP